jgi:phage tail sheath protein FI
MTEDKKQPQYLNPGVYIAEVPSGSRPIEGVGTSVAAFVGINVEKSIRSLVDKAESKEEAGVALAEITHWLVSALYRQKDTVRSEAYEHLAEAVGIALALLTEHRSSHGNGVRSVRYLKEVPE